MFTKNVYQKCLPKMFTKNVYQKCLPKMFTKNVYQKCLPKCLPKMFTCTCTTSTSLVSGRRGHCWYSKSTSHPQTCHDCSNAHLDDTSRKM